MHVSTKTARVRPARLRAHASGQECESLLTNRSAWTARRVVLALLVGDLKLHGDGVDGDPTRSASRLRTRRARGPSAADAIRRGPILARSQRTSRRMRSVRPGYVSDAVRCGDQAHALARGTFCHP